MTILTFAKTWPSAHTDSRDGPFYIRTETRSQHV